MNTRKRFALIFVRALLVGVGLVVVTGALRPAQGVLWPVQDGAPAVVAYQGEGRVSGTLHNSEGSFEKLTPDAHIAAVPYALGVQEAATQSTDDGFNPGASSDVRVVAVQGGRDPRLP